MYMYYISVKHYTSHRRILYYIVTVELQVQFTSTSFSGSESSGEILVTLELIGGRSSNPFNVTVTPSEQSPVSAKSNSIMCMIMC